MKFVSKLLKSAIFGFGKDKSPRDLTLEAWLEEGFFPVKDLHLSNPKAPATVTFPKWNPNKESLPHDSFVATVYPDGSWKVLQLWAKRGVPLPSGNGPEDVHKLLSS